MKRIHVVAAVIINSEDKVFLARRPVDKHQGGLWEFPGGKLEQGESRLAGLNRELHEELDIKVAEARPLIQVSHDYPDKSVLLDVWKVTAWEGEPIGKEGQETEWVHLDDLGKRDFPEANKPIILSTCLPSRWLVTPVCNRDNIDGFIDALEKSLRANQLVRFRNSGSLDLQTYFDVAFRVSELCLKNDCTLVIDAEHFYQADENGTTPPPEWGVHFTSQQLVSRLATGEWALPSGRRLSASCHSEKEVALAQEEGIQFVCLSPVKKTLSHPEAVPLGWNEFMRICTTTSMPVYALGGLGEQDLAEAFDHGGQGVAAISQFWVE